MPRQTVQQIKDKLAKCELKKKEKAKKLKKKPGKKIDPLKKAKYKQARKEGLPINQALLAAGYKETTANHKNNRKTNQLVKVGDQELIEEFKLEDLTPKSVLASLTRLRALCLKNNKYAEVIRIEELMGKYLAMWTDKTQITNVESQDDYQFATSRLLGIKANPLKGKELHKV